MNIKVILLILTCNTAYAQDVVTNLKKDNYDQYEKYQKALGIGTQVKKVENESLKDFFKRIYPTSRLHHGIFEFKNWKNPHGSYVIAFTKDDLIFGIGFISGILFEPTGDNAFRIIKVGEWTDECTGTSVEAVFRHNQKLFVITQENCRINGVFNNVFIYGDAIASDKLPLEDKLYEHCQYWWKEDEGGGDYVYPQGGEDTSDAKFVECKLNTYKKIVDAYPQ